MSMAVILSLVVGCSKGPATGQVEGKVTFKGKAVTEGTIQFLNVKEGGQAGAELDAAGAYKMKDPVVVGEYVVVITPGMEMKDTDPGKSPPAWVERHAPNIPPKYRMQGTTTLKATVKQGKNEINFDLTP